LLVARPQRLVFGSESKLLQEAQIIVSLPLLEVGEGLEVEGEILLDFLDTLDVLIRFVPDRIGRVGPSEEL